MTAEKNVPLRKSALHQQPSAKLPKPATILNPFWRETHSAILYDLNNMIRSVTLVKSIGSAKPGKARVINFKARVKPEARALEKTGLFSITTCKYLSSVV